MLASRISYYNLALSLGKSLIQFTDFFFSTKHIYNPIVYLEINYENKISTEQPTFNGPSSSL